MGSSIRAKLLEFLKALHGENVEKEYKIVHVRNPVEFSQIGTHLYVKDEKSKTIRLYEKVQTEEATVHDLSDQEWTKCMTKLYMNASDEDEDNYDS